METDDATIRAVEKILKEPVAAEFSEQAWRIRTNLTVVSGIAVVMRLADLRISADSSVLGLKFTGLSDAVIRVTLAAVIAYLLFHFLGVAWDALVEWRLRITGTRAAFQTGGMWGPDHADFPNDPRQSTLYNWWTHHNVLIGDVGKRAVELQAMCLRWIDELQKLRDLNAHAPVWQNMGSVINEISQSRAQAVQIAQNVE